MNTVNTYLFPFFLGSRWYDQGVLEATMQSAAHAISHVSDSGLCNAIAIAVHARAAHDVPPSLAIVIGDARLGEWAEG